MSKEKAQEKTLTPFQEVSVTLDRMKSQLKLVLPKQTSPDKFVRIVLTAITVNPSLLKCDRQSLYNACLKAAQDGLVPDSKEGVIIPFKDIATWMPMVGGLCKKLRNSGEIVTIDAQEVFENDEFDSWVDESGPHFKHKRARGDRGRPVTTYAYAITKDHGVYFEEIDESQMADIEKMSRANNSPWKGPFRGEMKRKSALRRLAKYRLPSSTDIEDVLDRESEGYELEGSETELSTEGAAAEKEAKPSRLSKMLSEREGSAEPELQLDVPDSSFDVSTGGEP